MPTYFTRTGDDGSTGLLGGGRVAKHHLRPRTYGALDEASAALGLARALAVSEDTKKLVVELQRDLYRIMAEVAAVPEEADKFRSVNIDRIQWLESQIDTLGDQVDMPQGFVLPGDSVGGGALDLARTIVRRAERRVTELLHEGQLENTHILAYLNRLSSLCFVLALWENKQAGVDAPKLAKIS